MNKHGSSLLLGTMYMALRPVHGYLCFKEFAISVKNEAQAQHGIY